MINLIAKRQTCFLIKHRLHVYLRGIKTFKFGSFSLGAESLVLLFVFAKWGSECDVFHWLFFRRGLNYSKRLKQTSSHDVYCQKKKKIEPQQKYVKKLVPPK